MRCLPLPTSKQSVSKRGGGCRLVGMAICAYTYEMEKRRLLSMLFVPMIFACTSTEVNKTTPAAVPSSTTPAPTPTNPSPPSMGVDAEAPFTCAPAAKAGQIYALAARDLADIEDVSMCQYRGKVMFIFNGASNCGNTPQYKPLQALHAKYEAQGLSVLGFPCNQFGGQEPGTGADISTFCTNEYGIKFPIFGKIDVNGPATHPIYKWLKAQPGMAADVAWNFEKFLISREGKVVKRFANGLSPDAPEVTAAIEAELAKPVPTL
jgi:glutathione peroxidase